MNDTPTFDFIVVGGGSAGCVLATRLSENPDNSVLLLEAGEKSANPLLRIPMGTAKVWNHRRYNWSYHSEPQAHADDRILFHPHGKVVGGSGAINMAAFVRGNRADYDGWAQRGLLDWSYDRLLPYFIKMESFQGGGAERGTDGPLQVAVAERGELEHLADALIAAGEANGYPHREDYNGEDQHGITRMQFNMVNGRRSNSATAYLEPALSRRNLTLISQAEVSKILFDGARATGVSYRRHGQQHQADARREVVLSSGAYNSPKLLMLSGIGPAAHLAEMDIPVLADRKGVGANLQDHPCYPTEYGVRRPSAFRKNLRWDRLFFNMVRAQLFRSGPASIPMGLAAGFLKSRPELEAPDLQIPLRYWSGRSEPWFPILHPSDADAIGFMVVHIQPESRGQVELRSATPDAAPRITNNFLSTEADRAALRAGFKIARQLIAHPALAAFVTGESVPGEKVQSDDEIDGHVRQFLGTMFHPVGTCRMGTDPDSVVDETLRVRNTEHLRVVDASVMPTISRGNTNVPTMMIAEKGADLILTGR